MDEGLKGCGEGKRGCEESGALHGGVWGWSIRGQSIGRGVRGWVEHRRRAWSIGGGWSIG